MNDEQEIKYSAVKRLMRELNYYRDELAALRSSLANAKDEFEIKKYNMMVTESLAVMRSTRDKMAEYVRELAEHGVEAPSDVKAAMDANI
ncbi:tubulin-specific chaperone a, putative [Babesia caballi]|uniref:Tubulin-specific chaperone A n=1 Tax=Babesia caballi TaxID=5871 RepID=A0AAV4LMF3_BABCB|nr:tubulin-specific chaperone a, putative [Babesia caballi]